MIYRNIISYNYVKAQLNKYHTYYHVERSMQTISINISETKTCMHLSRILVQGQVLAELWVSPNLHPSLFFLSQEVSGGTRGIYP